jgi:hypothetical protein
VAKNSIRWTLRNMYPSIADTNHFFTKLLVHSNNAEHSLSIHLIPVLRGKSMIYSCSSIHVLTTHTHTHTQASAYVTLHKCIYKHVLHISCRQNTRQYSVIGIYVPLKPSSKVSSCMSSSIREASSLGSSACKREFSIRKRG